MSKSPADAIAKIDEVAKAWETLAPTDQFGGMTLTQFKALVKPSEDTREAVSTLDKQMTAALNTRDAADVESLAKVKLVVNGVIGNPSYGPDSALYEAMGYVRESERKSGLTRKPKTEE